MAKLLAQFEDPLRKDITGFDIDQYLFTYPLDKRDTDEYRYEHLAWGLEFKSRNEDELPTFYPQNEYTDAEGNHITIPDMNLLSKEALEYWASRLSTPHPFMRLRYYELLHTFRPKLHVKHESVFYRQSTLTLFEVVREGYVDENHAYDYILLLLQRVKAVTELLPEIKVFLAGLIDRDSYGLWETELRMVNLYPKLFSDQEKEAACGRFADHYSKLISNNECEQAKFALPILLKYCLKFGKKDLAYKAIKEVEDGYRAFNVTGIRWEMAVRELQKYYRAIGSHKDEVRLNKDIQNASQQSIANMEKASWGTSLKNEDIQKIIDYYVPDEPKLQLELFIMRVILGIAVQIKELQKKPENDIFSLLTLHIYEDNYPSYQIGSYEKDTTGRILYILANANGYAQYIMGMCIEKMQESGEWTQEKLAEQITNCPIMTEPLKEHLLLCLKYYFEEKYLEFNYLLMPNIERFIRLIVDSQDVAIIRQKEHGDSYQLRMLDDLLRTDILKEVYRIGDDNETATFYMRYLLTEPRGLNYRNRLCHGMGDMSIFSNKGVADQLLHLLLFLTQIKLRDENQ